MDNLITPVFSGKDTDTPGIGLAPDGKRLLACYRDKSSRDWKTYISVSDDHGKSWRLIYDLKGDYYGPTFFSLPGDRSSAVYLFLTSHSGDFMLFKSTDSGSSWTRSTLLKASAKEKKITSGNTPALIHNGYLYIAVADKGGDSRRFPVFFRIFAGRCDLKRDISKAENWEWTNRLQMPKENCAEFDEKGWLEPNIVAAPDGRVVLVARCDSSEGPLGVIVNVDFKNKSLEFNENHYAKKIGESGFIDLPGGGCGMFYIKFDVVSKHYLMLSNPRTSQATFLWRQYRIRNVLALYESTDLIHWKWVKAAIKDDLFRNTKTSADRTGFQQPSFVIIADDMYLISRSAYATSKFWHDAGFITVHKLPDFRKLLDYDGTVAKYEFNNPKAPWLDTSRQGGNDADFQPNRSRPHRHCPKIQQDNSGTSYLQFDGKLFMELNHRVAMELHGAKKIAIAMRLFPEASDGVLIDIPIDALEPGIRLYLKDGKLHAMLRSHIKDAVQNVVFDALIGQNKWTKMRFTVDFSTGKASLGLNGKQYVANSQLKFSSKSFYRSFPADFELVGKSYSVNWPLFKGKLDYLSFSNR